MVIVELDAPVKKPDLASLEMIDLVRAHLDVDIVTVLSIPEMPVDRRHNSKIDRARLREWASGVLAGDSMEKI